MLENLDRLLHAHSPLLMGTLNCTPDSFSDGGQYLAASNAIAHAEQLISDGAHLLDIGGESTAPGSTAVDGETELARIEPVVTSFGKRFFLSIDTHKTQVAERCLSLGARLINDVTALRAEPELAKVISEHQAYVVLMYSQQEGGSPHVGEAQKEYQDVIESISSFLSQRIEFALSQGIEESKIILDPGMGGFLSPNPKYSWEVIRRLSELRERFRSFPLLIGTSRKGFLGGAVTERDPASQLTAIASFQGGADIIRTHNVTMAVEFFSVWKKCCEQDAS